MDDDQQFCLRWNNHQSTLISVFDTLLEKGIHVDCTLAAEGQTLKAHKVVLSACSPYFESVLSQQYDKHPIIILKDVKFAELRAMMDYMYRGEVNISQDQLAALLKAAESLQIKGLSDSKPPPKETLPLHKARILDSTASNNIISREGSSSPLPRKRRKPRRSSLNDTLDTEIQNNTDNIPPQNHIANNTTTEISKAPPITETPLENGASNSAKVNISDINDCAPKIKTDIPDPPDPKEEICEEGTEDSVEDLTLDEEVDSEVEQSGPGPSHPQEDCVQSFSWHMDRAQDESTPVDGQRDSQAATVSATGTDGDMSFTRIGGLSWEQWSARLALPFVASLRESATAAGAGGFACPDCGRVYKLKSSLRNHQKWECGKEPQFQCPYCVYRAKQKMHIARHMERMHREKVYVKSENVTKQDVDFSA